MHTGLRIITMEHVKHAVEKVICKIHIISAAVSGAMATASRTDEEAIEIGKGIIEAVQVL
jgi:hypothetical protein